MGLVITTSVEVQVCILEEIVQADSTGPVTRTTDLTIIDPDTGPVIDQAMDWAMVIGPVMVMVGIRIIIIADMATVPGSGLRSAV